MSNQAGPSETHVIAAVHTVLDPDALGREAERRYELGSIHSCTLLRSYANEVYHVSSDRGIFLLKVYRRVWRGPEDVAWEVRLQQHLAQHGVPVSEPLRTHDGHATLTLRAPEGDRAAVLMPQLPGQKPQRPFSPDLYRRFGAASARLHAALDDVNVGATMRPPRSLDNITEGRLKLLEHRFASRSEDWRFLCLVVDHVRAFLEPRQHVLDWGVIHGDLTLDNIHVGDEGSIAFFDFDLAAPAFRASDPAGVYAASRLVPRMEGCWPAFLDGYRDVRKFSAGDEATVPWFVTVQRVASLAHEVMHWARWSGTWRISDDVIDQNIGELRSWMTDELSLRL